jgi:hypothetical protein
MRADVDGFELLGQRRGREAAAPFVEVAQQNFRRMRAAVVHDRGEAFRLVFSLAIRSTEMHVEQVQHLVVDHNVRTLAAARLAGAPREVVLHVLSNRIVRQHDVAELMAAQMAHRCHHPSHAERGTDLLGVPGRVRAGAHHLLQRDDVGLEPGEDVDGALRERAPVHAAAAMNVVSDDSKGFSMQISRGRSRASAS